MGRLQAEFFLFFSFSHLNTKQNCLSLLLFIYLKHFASGKTAENALLLMMILQEI